MSDTPQSARAVVRGTGPDACDELGTIASNIPRTNSPAALDWSIFEDPARTSFVEELDHAGLRKSSTLQRVVDLAAALAGSQFAQISLIGDAQTVPAAHGLTGLADAQPTPHDESLCAVTMAYGQPLIIGDTRAHSLVCGLPPVASGQVGSYLGVPMRTSRGDVIGALCVYDPCVATWPDSLARVLEDLVVFAVNEVELIASVEAEALSVRQLTAVIQRIVAPADVAPPHDVEITGRFRSADVGGDWYDWTSLDGALSITIGDVAGHGLQAVATMATLKAYVRSYVAEGHGPANALRLASRVFADSSPTEMATVLDVRFDPRNRTLTYASAGHPPPLIVRCNDAFFAPLEPGPPLGFDRFGATDHRLQLMPDDLVLFYSDGLYEQRRTLADRSMDALRRAATHARRATMTVEQFADMLIDLQLSDTADDACLVALRV